MKRGWFSAIFSIFIEGVKEAFTPSIPADNWDNKELQHQDRMNGMSEKEIFKNTRRGRYVITVQYPKPRKKERGQIIEENTIFWHTDLKKYGSVEVSKWTKQGKYNLTYDELIVTDAIIKLNTLKSDLIRRKDHIADMYCNR